jgi:hypothetical protein
MKRAGRQRQPSRGLFKNPTRGGYICCIRLIRSGASGTFVVEAGVGYSKGKWPAAAAAGVGYAKGRGAVGVRFAKGGAAKSGAGFAKRWVAHGAGLSRRTGFGSGGEP